MVKGRQVQERLADKTRANQLINHLIQNYHFSPAVARSLVEDASYRRFVFGGEPRGDGHPDMSGRSVVSVEEPAGKPLKDCRYVTAKLTLYADEDAEYAARHGIVALRQRVLKRLADEALRFNGVLTVEDLSQLLFLERHAISNYLCTLQTQGIPVYTRAHFTDSGRGITHLERIIKLYLQGKTETDIARFTGHQLTCVENYLRQFFQIALAAEKTQAIEELVVMTGRSPSLLRSYLDLLQQLQTSKEFARPLQKAVRFLQKGQAAQPSKRGRPR